MPPIKVLLAEDSASVRRSIGIVLSTEPGISLIGEAGNYTEAMQKVADLKPDVAVIDLHMPDEREFSPAFINVHFRSFARHVLIVSVFNDKDSKDLAFKYGAERFLDKANIGTELIPAILALS
jgi:DNA-binding NarL/FixJ family response regulator